MNQPAGCSHSSRPDFKKAACAAVADERIGMIFDRSTRRKDEGRRAALPVAAAAKNRLNPSGA